MSRRSNNASEEMLCDLADLFKVFGDTTRLRILHCLMDADMCVGEISDAISMGQSAVSHQLKVLKDNNLVGSERGGKKIWYFLSDEHVRTIVGQAFAHLKEKYPHGRKGDE